MTSNISPTPTNSEIANKLKEQGNQQVKLQNYSQAIRIYREAIKLDELNPVFYSNISLCLYEIGDYSQSLEYSKKAIEFSEIETSYNLHILIKNLIRQAHIFFYQNDLNTLRNRLEKFSIILLKCNLETEPYLSFSREFNELKNSIEILQKEGDSNLCLMYNIPKFRSTTDTEANELYNIGHDNAMSALNCHEEENLQSQENSEIPIKTDFKKYNINLINLIESENKVELSFLYGGIGDCRHAYVTLIDIFYQLKEAQNKHCGNPEKINFQNVKISIGINDIHPNSLAKIIICLYSFQFLYDSSTEDLTSETKSAEICEMLHYIFFGAIMPEYINQRLMDILLILCKFELKDLLTQLPYIIIDEKTWISLRSVIARWLNEKCPCSNNAIMNRYTVDQSENDIIDFSQMNNEYCQNIDKLKEEKTKKDLEQTKLIIDKMSDEKIDEMLKLKKIDIPEHANKRDLIYNIFKEILSDDKFQKLRDVELAGCIKDNILVCKHKILFPPNKKYLEVFNLEKNIKVEKLPKEKVQETIKNWKLNVTMLDFDWIIKYGYAELSFNPVDTVGQIYKNKIIKSPSNTNKLYYYTSNYFLTIAQSLKFFCNYTPNVKLEILLGDIHSISENITLNNEERLKSNLAITYDRIFLSNIPDYTGMLSHFLYVFPLLKKNEFSYINSNILLATGLYKDYTEYIHTSTLMRYEEEYKKIFSATLINGDVWGQNKWGYYIGPEEKLNKEEFQLWLVKVFLYITMPTRRDERTQIRENYSSTMNLFFKLCHYMIIVRKYPIHWVVQVLENINKNNLYTKARFPYHSPSPVGFYDKNKLEKINLECFLLEFRTLYSIWQPLLGFSLFACSQLFDVAKFQLDLNIESAFLSYTGFCKSGILGLAIEAKSKSFNLQDDLRIRFMDYKSNDCNQIELNLITTLEFNSAKGIVYFWLSKSEWERLSQNDYQVYLLRTDSWKCIHKKVPLKNSILIQ